MLVGDLNRLLALKRLLSGKQFIEQNAGGVDIAARIGKPTCNQFGGEVGNGADQITRAGMR